MAIEGENCDRPRRANVDERRVAVQGSSRMQFKEAQSEDMLLFHKFSCVAMHSQQVQ